MRRRCSSLNVNAPRRPLPPPLLRPQPPASLFPRAVHGNQHSWARLSSTLQVGPNHHACTCTCMNTEYILHILTPPARSPSPREHVPTPTPTCTRAHAAANGQKRALDGRAVDRPPISRGVGVLGVPVVKATRPDARAGAIWDRVIKSPSPLPAAKALSPSPYANPPLSARRARAGPARMAGEKPRAKEEEARSNQAKARMQEKEARQQKQAAQMRMVRGARLVASPLPAKVAAEAEALKMKRQRDLEERARAAVCGLCDVVQFCECTCRWRGRKTGRQGQKFVARDLSLERSDTHTSMSEHTHTRSLTGGEASRAARRARAHPCRIQARECCPQKETPRDRQ